MLNFIKRIIPKKYHKSKLVVFVNKRIRDVHKSVSYAQEGEDLILKRIFETQSDGFFVDVGAHHPKRFSNTYLFYLMGWRGINIDAMPGSMERFDKIRPKDINIEAVISDEISESYYYQFKEPALNTINKDLACECEQQNELIGKIKIATQRLAKVLDDRLPKNQIIDFLSIDVEGADFCVLKSNNWEKYRPSVIVVEIRQNNIKELIDHQITKYLKEKGYVLFAKAVNSVFFKII